MEEIDYKLRKKDFMPFFGWREYRLRTKAPVIEHDGAKWREQLLAFYNVAFFSGSLLAATSLLEKITSS